LGLFWCGLSPWTRGEHLSSADEWSQLRIFWRRSLSGKRLSYTAFSFGKLKSTSSEDGRFTVTCDVTNTGHRSGATVAQLYVGQASTTVERPAKELKGFERVVLQPGETRHLSLSLDPRSFSYFDVKSSSWKADAGTYDLMLGDSSQNIQQKITMQLAKPITTSVSD
jgi:beta-glucosidase